MNNKPKKVILHCSATPDSDSDSANFGAADIRQWHIGRGFSDIGYHRIVKRSGEIEIGRHDHHVGAHCEGHNQDSLGFCYIGTKLPTEKQLVSLGNLYILTFKDYGITWRDWFGHYEFNAGKACPSFSMELFRKLLEYYHYLMLGKSR